MKIAIFAAAGLMVAHSLWGQSDTAVLFGVVKDPTGLAVLGAKVRVEKLGTNQAREAQTDDKGLFYMTLLPPGGYEVRVTAEGFKAFRDRSVRLQVAQVSRLDVELAIGSVAETVTVTGTASVLNTERVSHGTVITEEKLPALPLNGRQFLQLVLLVPGANPGGRTVQQNTLRQGQIGGLSIAGGRTNNTSFTLDGAINLDADYNSLNYSPSIDSIAEFQVQTAMVPAEYGRAAVNVATRSGSNQFHGGVWEFFRNRVFDARPFNLNSSLPQYQRNQFGGNLGGPLIRDRLFFFGAYEGLRVRQAAGGLTIVAVPSPLQRNGDFHTTRGGIYDPDTLGNGVRQPFPDFRIPASRVHPWSKAGLDALPLPSDPGTNTFVNAAGLMRQNNDNYSWRADFNATARWTMFGRYSASPENAVLPQTIPNRDSLNQGLSQNAALGSTYVVRSNLLNETRVGFSRLRLLTGVPEPLFQVNGTIQVLPQFNVVGYPLFGGAGGFNTTNAGGGVSLARNNNYQIYDNVSWSRGRHSVKFGGELLRIQYNRFEAPARLGNFQFTSGFTTRTARNDGTGDALASFLLALPAIANRALGPSRIDGRQWAANFYVMDDIKLRRNVTLNLGLRYELAPPLWDAHRQMSSIDYSKTPAPAEIFASGRTGSYKPTLFVCGHSGTPRGCARTDYNNLAPRLGIVIEPLSKTVIRAGAGVFYAGTDANPLFRLAAGLPANIAQTLNSDNFIPRFRGYDIFGPAVVGPVAIQAAGLDMAQRTSYTLQWNLAIQRELLRGTVIEAGYLATAGLKLEQNVQPNNALPGTGNVDPRRPYAGLEFAPGTVFPPYIRATGNSVPVGFINYLPHSAQSNYHSSYLRLERRFRAGFSLLSSYTWSKAITNAPQFRNAGGATGAENSPPQDSFNLRADRGLASFHVAHRWVSTWLYDLPLGPGARYLNSGTAGRILGGLQLSGIYTMQSGFPFTLNLRGDTAGVGAGTGGIFVRPNLVPGASPVLPSGSRTTARWFNTSAFVAPPAAQFGNAGKNTMIGPSMGNLDFVLVKNLVLTERIHLQIRSEVFNALNHPNFNFVGRILNDPTFGRVLNQLDPRQLQFGVKAIF